MARKTLTDKGVAALRPMDKLYAFPDPQCPGHYIRVSPVGSKSYVAVARDPSGKQKWITIANAAHLDIEDARKRARDIIVSVKGGKDHAGPQSFETVSKEWLKRHCEAKGLISTGKLRRQLQNHVLPVWGGRDFTSIKRSDIASLLDTIQDNSGPVAADKVLAILSGIFTWYATRNDDYNSPIVRGMRRTKMKERARDRILSDDEIRLVWSKGEGLFGDLVKMLLLTAQRREKVVTMKWDDVSADGVWHVANGSKREKGTGGELALPAMALDIIHSRPRLGSNPFVFASDKGNTHFASYNRRKPGLDRAIGASDWTLHDLRRTARSLMSRAGVRPDIAERVLGHVQPGVAGTYDRHQYRDEKAHALNALASLIQLIVNPTDRVIALRK